MALTLRGLIPAAWRPKPRFEDNTPIGQPIAGLVQGYVSPWAESGIQVTPTNARESPTVFACVRLISTSIARMEWRVFAADETGAPRPMPRHPLWRLLNDEPNPYMSGFTFRESMLTDCLLFGNAYAYIERDASARPVALQKLRPDLVYVARGTDNAPVYHYAAGTGGGSRVLQGFDVFHLSGPGSDGLLGDPTIYLAREVIGLEIVTTKFVSRFFQNGGRPAGALTTPGTLSPEALDRLRQSWQALHSGADNAGRVAILEAGMKFEKMSIDPDEAQLLELRSYCREQIAAAFGVPPHLVGDSAKQSYASAEQADMEYVKHCLGAWASRLERETARKLIVNQPDVSTRISFDELLRGDMQARFTSYNTALQSGFLTINEVRAREGLPPVDGGDRVRVPLNMETLDPDANVPGDDAEDIEPSVDSPAPEPSPEVERWVTTTTGADKTVPQESTA